MKPKKLSTNEAQLLSLTETSNVQQRMKKATAKERLMICTRAGEQEQRLHRLLFIIDLL